MSEADPSPTLVVLAAGRARRYGGVKPLAPVGASGEAVIDLLASDALAAGFRTIVLVISPATGPAIRYHVEHTWPRAVDVRFAEQEAALGTVHAVLCASDALDPDLPVGVGNADDLYGRPALELLAGHLGGGAGHNALVGFRLRDVVLGSSPVTRGVCGIDQRGFLTSIVERRQVFALGDDRFVSKDGSSPDELPGDSLVSMNLWAFTPTMRELFGHTMEAARHASEDTELLLPEVVAQHLSVPGPGAEAGGPSFQVLAASGRCLGVTHPDDLAIVQAELAREVGAGERPAALWSALG